MLDLKQLRRDPEPARAALARRRDGSEARLDRVLELDERTRALRPETEALRARQNEASKAIGRAKQEGRDAAGEIAEMQEVAQRVRELGQELAEADAELQAALETLPNPPDPTAADADTTLREVGTVREGGRDHLDLAGRMIDMEAGSRVAGSRFAYLRGDLVLVELALVQWALAQLVERGFEPVVPPVLVREEALYGTGFLPDTEQQIYRLPDDDLYLVGTSEVPLASLHGGEILDAGSLPRRYAGVSPCFRREAGAAGRDTRGIFRVHQFDKVEMFSFVEPEASPHEHDLLLSIEESLLQQLGIPYRVVNIGADDLGTSAAKKYDLEAWMPSQGRYREVTSTSNTTDFQARRLNIRHRDEDGRPRYVHTLNGTAVTWRHLIALLENHQREDGSVEVPEVLQRWGAPAVLRVDDPA
ncbi:MAG TPA: serine--tRNA ligase [Solirubrobacteraceae bacterium]|nr:serine--tRNA ligase [Solirubrobacteraceae bacterium]